MRFRRLRTLAELEPVEELQRAVFAGILDRDLAAAGMLVVVPETGGEVLGASVVISDGAEQLVGFAIGWGGFVDGRPRLLSDMLGVRPGWRGGGLGAELKRLQAALAVAAGFVEMVWTVDPLRAANARLNFEKLGAWSDWYEVDRYGSGFAADLYGDLPTDRLHITWPLTDPVVRDRLLGRAMPRTAVDAGGLPVFNPGSKATSRQVLVSLPADIDALLRTDPAAALKWRLRLRETLTAAFAQGFRIVGFAPALDSAADPAYVLERP